MSDGIKTPSRIVPNPFLGPDNFRLVDAVAIREGGGHIIEIAAVSTELDRLRKRADTAERELERARVALRFYAKRQNHPIDSMHGVMHVDRGEVARVALTGEETKP